MTTGARSISPVSAANASDTRTSNTSSPMRPPGSVRASLQLVELLHGELMNAVTIHIEDACGAEDVFTDQDGPVVCEVDRLSVDEEFATFDFRFHCLSPSILLSDISSALPRVLP